MAWPGKPAKRSSSGPKAILGALCHSDFDAADSALSVSVGKVVSIPSRGYDNAPLTQGSASLRPVYGATSFAGGPGMTFDGATQWLLATFASALALGCRPYVWVVFRQLDSVAAPQACTAFAANAYWAFYTCTAASTFSGTVGGVAGYDSQNIRSVDTTGNHCGEIGLTAGGVAALTVDGSSVNISSTIADPPQTSATAVSLGYFPGFGQFSHVLVRRLIVANNEPSAAQKTAMRAYLKSQPYALP